MRDKGGEWRKPWSRQGDGTDEHDQRWLGTQRNEGAYDTLEALKVIDHPEGPDECPVHGECAGRTCPSNNDGRLVRQNCEGTEVEGGKDSRDQSSTTSGGDR